MDGVAFVSETSSENGRFLSAQTCLPAGLSPRLGGEPLRPIQEMQNVTIFQIFRPVESPARPRILVMRRVSRDIDGWRCFGRRGHPLLRGWSHSPPVGEGGVVDVDVVFWGAWMVGVVCGGGSTRVCHKMSNDVIVNRKTATASVRSQDRDRRDLDTLGGMVAVGLKYFT